MITIHSIDELQSFLSEEKQAGKKIGFIPTMGALHDGHISLVHAAKQRGNTCVMSIFVNPTQFGPNEDFSKYPRTLETDKNLAFAGGVNFLFAPSEKTIYPPDQEIKKISPPANMNSVLCGPFRPGHFEGVCTVVNRLLEIVQPDELFLGQKDAQQLRILQETMKPLHPNTEIIGAATVRESDGLAMSSRNKYLSAEERQQALIISKALSSAHQMYTVGEKSAPHIVEHVKKILSEVPEFQPQYVELVRWSDFAKME
ncbi:MAG: pantoate--beta-alanine ligase, partial [Proteobacteria bacterium]|nr:pantoate--beta-alanine ligase [Pseudomonadota bacterium]